MGYVDRPILVQSRRLTEDKSLQQFDVIVSNPPYSIENWASDIAEADPYHRFDQGIPPRTRGNSALILHMVSCMKPDTGRIAVVVPQGVLFRGTGEAAIRKRLIEENLVDAVIGLPEKLLYNASIPVSILILRKGKIDSNIFFIDASDAFVYGRMQNSLSKEHIESIATAYRNWATQPGRSALVSNSEIDRNDTNLSVKLYVEQSPSIAAKTITELMSERRQILDSLSQIEQEIEGNLRTLGFLE